MGFELHDPEALLATLRSFPKETDWVEFKANKFDSEAVRRYVSGLANAAMFQRQKLAYMVWGVADGTHEIVGTTVRLESETVGAEAFLLWLNKYVRPKINVHHCPFDLEGKHIEMLVIEPGYQQPVSFSGREYIRVATSLVPLSEHVEKQRTLWQITSSYSFENSAVASHMSAEEITQKFSVAPLLRLLGAEGRTATNSLHLL